VGSALFAVVVSVAKGRFTSLDTGMVASVVGDVVEEAVAEFLVYVDDSITTTLGQVREATSEIVVDG
jgi:hypothetical protein